MPREPSLEDFYTLTELIIAWDRGELTLDEILQRWPHPKATREQTMHDIRRVVIALRARIAAIDGLGGG